MKKDIMWTWMLTWLRFKVFVWSTLKRNASYGQEDFPFKHFKLFEYGWLGTYIAMIFWVAKIFINQSLLLWSLFLQNLLGETLFFHQTFSTFAKLRNWEFFFQPSYPKHYWFIISQAFPKWIKDLLSTKYI